MGTGIGFIKSHNIICFFYFRVEIVTVSYMIGVVLRVSYLCEGPPNRGRFKFGGWEGWKTPAWRMERVDNLEDGEGGRY